MVTVMVTVTENGIKRKELSSTWEISGKNMLISRGLLVGWAPRYKFISNSLMPI